MYVHAHGIYVYILYMHTHTYLNNVHVHVHSMLLSDSSIYIVSDLYCIYMYMYIVFKSMFLSIGGESGGERNMY